MYEAETLWTGEEATAFSALKSKVSIVLDPYSMWSRFGRFDLLKTRSKAPRGREFRGNTWAIQTRNAKMWHVGRWSARRGSAWTLSNIMKRALQPFERRGRGRRVNVVVLVHRGCKRWSNPDAALRCWVCHDSHGCSCSTGAAKRIKWRKNGHFTKGQSLSET
jgi:hypothetical protein